MHGDNIIKEYKYFEMTDTSNYRKFQEYIRQYLTAEAAQALQEMIDTYNSPILKWERFKEYLTRRPTTLGAIGIEVENVIYTTIESGGKINILNEVEKAVEEYRLKLIMRGARKDEQI